MVDSKHDVVTKPEKHDWTFFAFFAIALILIASAIVWATAKAGLFNANGLDDDSPQRVSLPSIPVPSAADQTSEPDGSTAPDASTEASSSEASTSESSSSKTEDANASKP